MKTLPTWQILMNFMYNFFSQVSTFSPNSLSIFEISVNGAYLLLMSILHSITTCLYYL